MLPQAHGAGRRRPTGDPPARRTRRRRRGPTCSTASTWSATRPRWSAPGCTVADLPDVRRPQRPRHRRAAGGDARGRRRPAGARLARWWSTARAATPAPSTATRRRRRARAAALDAGDFENHCPACGGPLGWALVDEDARLDPRSSYAASKVAQEHYAAAWVRQAGAAAVALRYHNVYGPGMPRDTPYSGVAAMFRSSLERGEAPQVFEDGGQMRDFVHVADVARANVLALDAVVDGRAGLVGAYNVCSGHAGLDPRGRRAGRARAPARPRARGDRRLPARRRPPRRRLAGAGRARELGFTAPRCSPERRGCARSRTAPLPRLSRRGSPAGVEEVLRRPAPSTTWSASPSRRQRSGSSAVESSSHGTNGSQIRSTSALLIRDRSASDHDDGRGPDQQQHRPRSAPARAARPRARRGRRRAAGRRERAARRGCPTSSTPRAGRAAMPSQ